MQATFHSNKGEKSALIIVQDEWSVSGTPVYVPRTQVDGLKAGDAVTIPNGLIIADWKSVVTKDGEEIMLKQLVRA